MKWIIQDNLGSYDNQLINSCKTNGITFEAIKVIPFDPTIPNIPTNQSTLFYGSTNFVTNIWKSNLWKPGVFFNEENFTFRSYKKYWDILNSEAKIMTIKDLYKENINPDEFIFIRPNKDLKEFAGEVITGSHYRTYGHLKVSKDLPKEVIEFAKIQVDKWSPSVVFAIDIARCGNNLYVVEANCFNSSGFYDSDINKLVNSITSFCDGNFS